MISVWSMVVFVVCSAVQQSRPAESPADLRVMTFNIRLGTAKDGENDWAHRKDLACEVIRTYRADVIGLQEAMRFQLDDIRKALPIYEELGVGRDDGQKGGEYSAILYRGDRLKMIQSGNFWFSETPEVPGSKSWNTACTRLCSWARFEMKSTGQTFYFYNLHLDHKSQPARDHSVELLSERIHAREKKDEPVIVTGDFNAGEKGAPIRFMKGELARTTDSKAKVVSPKLVDTFRVLHPDAKDVATAAGFKGGRVGEKIDYIFAPADVRVLETEIIYDQKNGRYPSDHYPVMATLRLPKKGS